MKICFLVLSADYQPWNNLYQDCGKVTWANVNMKGIEFDVFEYRGKALNPVIAKVLNRLLDSKFKPLVWKKKVKKLSKVRLDSEKNMLRCSAVETWDRLLLKTLSAMRYILNEKQYDYVIRINSTTYVNLESPKKVLEEKPDYAGCPSIKAFAPGWAIVLSRKSAEILTQQSNFPLLVGLRNDDDAIGQLLGRVGHVSRELKCAEVNEMSLSREEVANVRQSVFIRIKSKSDRERNDPAVFQFVHSLFSIE